MKQRPGPGEGQVPVVNMQCVDPGTVDRQPCKYSGVPRNVPAGLPLGWADHVATFMFPVEQLVCAGCGNPMEVVE